MAGLGTFISNWIRHCIERYLLYLVECTVPISLPLAVDLVQIAKHMVNHSIFNMGDIIRNLLHGTFIVFVGMFC